MGRRFRFLESFDGGNIQSGHHWTEGGALAVTDPAVFVKSARVGDDFGALLNLPSDSTDPSQVHGAYAYVPSAGQLAGEGTMIVIFSTSGYHLWVMLDGTSNEFVFKDANQAEITRCDAVYDEWFACELGYTIDNTAGAFEFYINGVLQASGSGLDLYAAGGVYGYSVRWGGSGGADINSVYVDNGYMADTDNTGVWEYLGAWTVEALHPDGNGYSSDWVGTDGNSVDNYLLVSKDTDPWNEATRLISSTDGDIDTFTFDDLADNTVTPLAVAVTGIFYGWGGGDRLVSEVLRVDGTNYYGDSEACITTWDGHHHVWETNPGGGDWTGAAIDALEAGYRSDGVTATESLFGHCCLQVLHQVTPPPDPEPPDPDPGVTYRPRHRGGRRALRRR